MAETTVNNDNSNELDIEILQSSEALQEKISNTEDMMRKNSKILSIIMVVLILCVGGYIGYTYMMEANDKKAQVELFPAVFYFESDSTEKALNGDGATTKGLLYVIEEYSGTKSANLATYYSGIIYLKQGDYDKAITYLSKYKSSDLLTQARAYSLIGDAYMEKAAYADAISNYKKATTTDANEEFTPVYFFKLALAQEKSGNYSEAQKTYQSIVDMYPKSPMVPRAKKMVAKSQILSETKKN